MLPNERLSKPAMVEIQMMKNSIVVMYIRKNNQIDCCIVFIIT
jgi:hypothetical protein